MYVYMRYIACAYSVHILHVHICGYTCAAYM
jgi:hypothetical protein